MAIDIESPKIDCLSFVYVPATSAALIRLLFFIFLLRLFTVLMKKTCSVKQSIFLDVYGSGPCNLPRLQEIVVSVATVKIMVLHTLQKQKAVICYSHLHRLYIDTYGLNL